MLNAGRSIRGNMLTVLAEGSKYALIGDTTGEITYIPLSALPNLSPLLNAPCLIPCPPLDAPKAGSLFVTVRHDIPLDAVIKFRYYICPVSLILIYYAFIEEGARWFLRELRGTDGKGTGNYYSEGGDYEPPGLSKG
jgi:hypothetical protein